MGNKETVVGTPSTNSASTADITALAEAITKAEGGASNGSNNPGSLALGDKGAGLFNSAGVTQFNSPEEGQQALHSQLSMIANGTSKNFSPDMTLKDFAKTWTGGDKSDSWAATVASHLGLTPDDTLSAALKLPTLNAWQDVPDTDWQDVKTYGPPAPATTPSNDLFRNHPPSLGIRRQQQEPTDKKLARGRAADKVGEVSKDAATVGGLAATGIGIVEAPLAVAGGIAGNYIGSEGGERIARHYFPDSEDAATLGRWTGGALGTLAGGKMGDSITFPDEVSLPFGIKMKTPSWLPHTPTPPLGSPENPGYMAKLPTRMPKPVTPPDPDYESPIGPSAVPTPEIDYSANQKLNARAGKSITNRSLGAPTTGRSGNSMSTGPVSPVPQVPVEPTPTSPQPYGGGSKNRPGFTRNRSLGSPETGRSGMGAGPAGLTPRPPIAPPAGMGGGGIAPEDDSVLTVPEENPPFPGQNPNYAASTPRADLVGQAKTGKPGAAKQLMQLGRKILYTPRY